MKSVVCLRVNLKTSVRNSPLSTITIGNDHF